MDVVIRKAVTIFSWTNCSPRTMGPTLSPETSAFKLQTPGKFPEEYKLHNCRKLTLDTLQFSFKHNEHWTWRTVSVAVLISSANHYIDILIGALNIRITSWAEEWRGVVQLVETLRFKPEDHGFDSRLWHWYYSFIYSFWPYNGPGVDSACNMNIQWEVKAAGL